MTNVQAGQLLHVYGQVGERRWDTHAYVTECTDQELQAKTMDGHALTVRPRYEGDTMSSDDTEGLGELICHVTWDGEWVGDHSIYRADPGIVIIASGM